MNSFFPRKLYRTAALLYLLLFLAVGAASAGSAWVEAPKDRRFLGVMIFSTFWGAWAIAAAWMLLASYRSYLHVWGDNLIWQGAFFLREIGIHDITAARWKSMHKGSLRLFTPKARLTIDFDLFEPEERIWLIQFFRSRLPDSIQHDWGRFCLTVALPLREPEPPAPRQLPADKILITRRRWDWYFIPFILVFALIGLVLFLALQQPRMLAAPHSDPALAVLAFYDAESRTRRNSNRKKSRGDAVFARRLTMGRVGNSRSFSFRCPRLAEGKPTLQGLPCFSVGWACCWAWRSGGHASPIVSFENRKS